MNEKKIPFKQLQRAFRERIRELGGSVANHPDDDVIAMMIHAQLGMKITNNKVRKVCNVGYHRAASIMIELEDRGVLEKKYCKPPLINYCHL